MLTMYERIDCLCKERGTNVTAMCKELGIARSSLSELNSGRSKTLSAEKTAKIATFLGVTVDYLLGRETDVKEKTAGTSADGLNDYDARILSWFHSLPQEKREAILNLGDGPKK